jgi:hypothetical protein
MIKKLMDIKDELIKLYEYFDGKELDDIMLQEQDWEFMMKFHAAFDPCYLLTLKLQKSHVSMGSFYFILLEFLHFLIMFLYLIADFHFLWKKCIFQLIGLKENNDHAKYIHDNMMARSKKMYDDNDALIASLYIDPRYKNSEKLMNPNMKARAEVLLCP